MGCGKVKIKICGITNTEDAHKAVELGADALGFIFAPSPRKISPEDASEIIIDLPPFVKTVGVFVNEDLQVIKNIIGQCGLDIVQLHGNESPDLCNKFMPRTIKALRVKDHSMPDRIIDYKGKVRAFLLDTYSPDKAGGTGKTFNWDMALKINEYGIPIILAGGIGPSNVEEALSMVKPYGLDISSGIEEIPGKKDHKLMEELFEKIRSFS